MNSGEVATGASRFDFQDIIEIALRRWRTIALGAVAGLILGLSLWAWLPPLYQATTTILVEPQGIPESYVRSTITLEIEHRVHTLGQRVTSHASLNKLIDLIGTERLDPSGKKTREDLMSEIRRDLTVEVDNPYKSAVAVVELRHEGRQPEVVAAVVREIANLFIEENRKDRVQQAASTAEFVEKELTRIRGDLTVQEQKIREYRIARLGALPSQLEANMRELDRLNESLAVNLEARDRLVHQISILSGQRSEGGGAATPGSRAASLAQAREALLEARRIYTDDHPTVLALRAQTARLEREIEAAATDPEAEWMDPALEREIETVTFSLKSRRNEAGSLRGRIADLDGRIGEAPRNEQEMLELTRDYDTMKQTYQLMLGNKHDAALSSNLEEAQMAEQFKMLRPARVPNAPFSPDPLLVVPAGIGVGLALAALIILLAELRRPAFHSPDTLARRLGLPIFASIPDLVREKIYAEIEPPESLDWRLVVAGAPNSAAAEQYRGFVPQFLETEECRLILVTSAHPGDGKTVTCMNLACTLATDLGRRVLVIDADLRRASQHRLVRVDREPGLSDVLVGEAELGQCTRNVLPNLSLLPAGSLVENPLALLTDEVFYKLCEQACENYEVVLIDSPPILPVIDAKILRRMADMVVFVVRAGVSPSGGVLRSMRELKNVAGVIFNRVSPGSFRRYYYYDAYSQYEYRDAPYPGEAGGLRSKILARLNRKSKSKRKS